MGYKLENPSVELLSQVPKPECDITQLSLSIANDNVLFNLTSSSSLMTSLMKQIACWKKWAKQSSKQDS